ncbi:MAG: hypothetical protein RL180_1673 [Pseudomonadota bacterium]
MIRYNPPLAFTVLLALSPLLLTLSQGHTATPPVVQRADLFQSVFQRSEPIEQLLSAQALLIVDQQSTQMLQIKFSSQGQTLLVEGAAFCQVLAQYIPMNVSQTLLGQLDRDGWLDQRTIQKLGFQIRFDPIKQRLYLKIPSHLRGQQIEYLTAPKPNPWDLPIIQPATTSAFLNYNVKARQHTDQSTAPQLAYNMDGALQWKGVVLETSAFGQLSSHADIQRGATRVVYDHVPKSRRYRLGDLPTVPFSTPFDINPLLGVAIEKYTALQPHRQRDHNRQLQLYLEEPAKIDIRSNQLLIHTLTLPAGQHDLRGLSLLNGLNNVTLHIEYNSGRQEVRPFSFLLRPELLPKGAQHYTYQIGWQCEKTNNVCDYDFNQPMLLGHYLSGVLDRMTLGINAAVQQHDQQIGFKQTVAFANSVIELQQSIRHQIDTPLQFEAKANGLYAANQNTPYGLEPTLAIEYRNNAAIMAAAQRNTTEYPYQWAIRTGLNARQWAGGQAQVSAYYQAQKNLAQSTNTYGIAANLSHSITPYLSSVMGIKYHHQGSHQTNTEYRLGLQFSLDRQQISVQQSTDTSSINWRARHNQQPYNVESFINMNKAKNSQDYDAGLQYTSPIGDVSAAIQQYDQDTNITVALQGGIAVAENQWALSRRISDSFIMVKGQYGLSQTSMNINPDHNNQSAFASTGKNPAVLYQLSSYHLRPVRVHPINPPFGALPKNLEFLAFSRYKTGAVLKIGRPQTMVVMGKVRTISHQPSAYARLRFKPVNTTHPILVAQTSPQGLFSVGELQIGTYHVWVNDEPIEQPLVIPTEPPTSGVIRLADLIVSTAEKD